MSRKGESEREREREMGGGKRQAEDFSNCTGEEEGGEERRKPCVLQ